jgi:hypothetical protein
MDIEGVKALIFLTLFKLDIIHYYDRNISLDLLITTNCVVGQGKLTRFLCTIIAAGGGNAASVQAGA